jgi:hypothetical protein
VAEGISVQKLQSPLEKGNEAAEDTEQDVSNHTTNTAILASLLPCDGAHLAQELDNGDKQTAQTDGSEAVGKSALGRTAGRAFGEVVHAEIPCTIDSGDDGVNRVLEPLRNPVHGKGDKDGQPYDRAFAAATAIGATLRVISRRLVRDIDGSQRDGEPGSKSGRKDASNQGHKVDVTILFADVDASFEHQGREWNTRDPCVKGEGGKQPKDEKDYSSGPVFLVEIKDGGSKGPTNVENACDPNELFGEYARKGYVSPGQEEGNNKTECEENDGIVVEAKSIFVSVDAVA